MHAISEEINEGGAWLQRAAHDLVRRSARPMTDDRHRTAFVPQAEGGYNGFWVRDYAYMLQGCVDSFTEKELIDSAILFVESLREGDAAGVDTILFSGEPKYQPGYGTMGTNPVADGSQFTVEVIWRIYQRLRDKSLLTRVVAGQPLVDRLIATMNSVPRSKDSGLVFIDPALDWDRASYGFTDSVRKTGDLFFESLLYVQASRQLADLLDEVDRGSEATVWRTTANSVSASILATFWDPEMNLFRAATVQCREHDVWGSAFAVHLGVASETQADAIANYFDAHYNELVQAGQIRHLPGGIYWQVSSAARDYYQNGTYWPVPTGWFAKTLARVNPELAGETFVALIRDFRARGINEWVIGGTVGVPFYTASATMPLAMMRELYNIPDASMPVETGGTMGQDNIALASMGGVAFAKDVIADMDEHQIAHLNDGLYGNGNSWLAGSLNSYAGVAFRKEATIKSIAFGRDNGGGPTAYADRDKGLYTLQYTRVKNPGATTPDEDWTTLSYFVYSRYFPNASDSLRHRYEFEPVKGVTAVRLVIAAETEAVAIDELEVYAVTGIPE
jgi:hypothetical protein